MDECDKQGSPLWMNVVGTIVILLPFRHKLDFFFAKLLNFLLLFVLKF